MPAFPTVDRASAASPWPTTFTRKKWWIVDRVLAEAVAAGAALFKPAQEVFWGGYSGYFGDPDGHPWEIVYNPHWGLTPEGRLILPA
jgi:uncharacterized glyoxalase superfamily protein PhnB